MADRSILYRLRAALQGGFVALANEVETAATYPGVLAGVNNIEAGLQRLDGTGVGASIFRFTGSYSAQASNISEWFGNRQLTRMRCTDNGGINPVVFTLPGATALNTAFDTLVANGLPEMIQFVIEYTGPNAAFLSIVPRSGVGNPVILNTTNIIVRSGIAATVEITRTSSVLSDYVFAAIGGISDTTTGGIDSIKLINPATAVWNANDGGNLPNTGVVKGNAYRVANAPTDGSGRFDEPMQNLDWVVWSGESFSSWAAEPHQWFVLPAHDVRRISAVGQEFLNDVSITPVSSRNAVIRGANYADTAGEIRLKIYPTVADYDAADLNTTGDIDEYTDPANQSGYLAIRLAGTDITLADVLPTLYVFSERAGVFTELFNMSRDMNHQGNFGAESDYISNETIDYTANDVIRIYLGTDVDRFNAPNLDINLENLTQEVQDQLSASAPWSPAAAVLFSDSEILDTSVADRVEYSPGYERGVDWRDMAFSTTINANRYLDSDLTITASNASFEVYGFGNNIRKLVGVKLQRNDAEIGEGAMLEFGSGEAFMRVNTSNEIQFNTTPGSGSTNWVGISSGLGNLTLGAGSNNFIVFEMVLRNPADPTLGWELLADFFDGTNYHEANNIDFTPTGEANGDHLGFSRSDAQRGQILEFRAINSPGYLTHSQLDTLLRNHQDDKWDFGFARLFQGASSRGVVIRHFILQSPNGTNYSLSVNDDGSLKTDVVT